MQVHEVHGKVTVEDDNSNLPLCLIFCHRRDAPEVKPASDHAWQGGVSHMGTTMLINVLCNSGGAM